MVPSHVSMDMSGITGTDFQFEIALSDNSGVIGDSWAVIDNVVFGAQTDDFEGGTIGGSIIDPLNPASVNVVPENLAGTGSWVFQVGEDPVVA